MPIFSASSSVLESVRPPAASVGPSVHSESMEAIQIPFALAAEIAKEVLNYCPGPVSYPHLDVYKTTLHN